MSRMNTTQSETTTIATSQKLCEKPSATQHVVSCPVPSRAYQIRMHVYPSPEKLQKLGLSEREVLNPSAPSSYVTITKHSQLVAHAQVVIGTPPGIPDTPFRNGLWIATSHLGAGKLDLTLLYFVKTLSETVGQIYTISCPGDLKACRQLKLAGFRVCARGAQGLLVWVTSSS